MRRTIIAVSLAGALAGIVLSADPPRARPAFELLSSTRYVSPETADWRWRFCKFQTVEPGTWTRHEIHLTLRCAVNHWSIDVRFAEYVIGRESGWRYWAVNSSSGACGLFQHIPRYWPERREAVPSWWHLKPSCFNARSNVVASVRMIHPDRWGPWGG